jgi:3-carboxy-cis,cis-muconate cycloisomerase
MRQPSSSSEGLLGPLFSSPDVEQELSDTALLHALLRAESALAAAAAQCGIVPSDAAEAIENACRDGIFDLAALGAQGESAGNPVVPLVRALVAQVPESAKPWVHYGATSQDILDTALMLLARNAGRLVVAEAASAVGAAAALADAHRGAVMLGRTLGQQAVVTTFGLKAASWLTALDAGGSRLASALENEVAVQLGGAAGTLGVLGSGGPDVARAFAAALGLVAPPLPWHTDRQRILALAAALGGVVAAAGKVALDVELLAQTEIGEVAEGGDAAHGGSSAMPHKRNPIDSVLVRAAAYRAPGLVVTLFSASQHELERAAGAWHAEWAPLRGLLSLAGGALTRVARLIPNLVVDTDRMREDVENTRGLVMAEQLTARLAPMLGRTAASDVIARCCEHARRSGRHLRDVALADDTVRSHLSAAQIDATLDPRAALGAVDRLIDNAVAQSALLAPPRSGS